MKNFEKLGVFYLGKTVTPETGQVDPDYLLYDSRDLVTHAVCVGMTGSGKTGLCIALLEEAAIDSIPGIIIDPKGDLGDLLLTFPDLKPPDFRPWINEDAARSQGVSPDAFAAAEAERWRKGLAEWDQDEGRIQRLRASADFAIYTPGSTAGLPISIAASFGAPSQQDLADREILGERIASTASSLLGLIGIQADPLRSREHILISTILEHAWRSRKDVTLASLIQSIQSPPVQRVGVFDMESFYPSVQRTELAMMLNNLLAAPGFGAWLEGEPLDIARLLYTPEGKPRMSVFSIAHLSDSERMFFVTILLNQVLSWMRSQPGTSSLRSVLYMDEIFGFFPPVAEPPSKKPLLTLLKQARAYGLGVVLATQNPVDLDYKGLANTGTWMIGRLQTERDRDRLIEGLSGIAAGPQGFDRGRLTAILSGLKPRTFLLQNVHEDHPVLFASRWCLSYLPGPLTRPQIRELTAARAPAGAPVSAAPPAAASPLPASISDSARAQVAPSDLPASPPQLPPEVTQFFAPVQKPATGRVVYHPFLLGAAKLQMVNNKYGISSSQPLSHVLELRENMTVAPWDQASPLAIGVEELSRQAPAAALYLPVPTTPLEPKRLQTSQKGYLDFAYRQSQTTLWKSNLFKLTSQPGESEQEFRLRLQQLARERRDFEIDRLRQRYAARTTALQQRLMRAGQRIGREQEQFSEQKVQTAISVGATLLGALMGRKALSSSTLGRAVTATRQASRIVREKQDVERAREEQESVQTQISELEQELQREVDGITEAYDPQKEVLQPIIVRPTRQDILLQQFGLLWAPYAHMPDGSQQPLWG
jgi:hypothetical protein